MAGHDHPDGVNAVTAEHVRRFLIAERERTSPGNAARLYRTLRVWFGWLIEEGERTEPNPVRPGDRPKVPEKAFPPLTADDQRALLATCGNDSEGDGTPRSFGY